MKTHRMLILCVAALLGTAPSLSLSAADVVVDISSFAPRDPDVVLRQIDLNVALKQYEKALMDLYEARLQFEIEPTEPGLTDDQTKGQRIRALNKVKYLENTVADLRARIAEYVKEANEKAKATAAPSKNEPHG